MTNVGATGWPVAPAVGGWGQEPQNMMPKRIQGWPAGTQRAANDAERLLSQAVGWWDAAWYTPGDRFLRNRGVAGELLDMRLGSSLAANSNDPLYLAPEATGYCYLSNVPANGISVADEPALRPTGDLDLRVLISREGIASGTNPGMMSKWAGAGARSFRWWSNNAGTLRFEWSADGTNAVVSQVSSTSSLTTIPGNGPLWIRVTLDVDNGATGNTVTYYTSPENDGTTWTQLGNAITNPGTTSVFASTTQINVGAIGPLSGEIINAKVYQAQIFASINGTDQRLALDCDALTDPGATSFTATTGQTVTINRATSGRKTVAMPARGRGGRALFLLGTDDYLEVQDNWQHQLLNFGQGDSFTVLAVVRQWNTPTNLGAFITKATNAAPFTGWAIRNNATALSVIAGDAGTNVTSSSYAAGALTPISFVVDRSSQRNTVNVLTTAVATTAAPIDTRSPAGLFVGRYSNGTLRYQDFEFTSAAVLRRALSAAEIKLISDYYATRGF